MSATRELGLALSGAAGDDRLAAIAGLLPLLARDGAVSAEAAATALGSTRAELDATLARLSLRVERDERGAIVGAGLTSVPTRHRFRVGGHDRYVWCALDALLFPVLLDASAAVESVCAITGEPIRFTSTPHGVARAIPPTTHVVLVPPAACCSDLRTSFCDQVVFTKDAASAAQYVATRPSTWAVTLEEASRLARDLAGTLGVARGASRCGAGR